VPFHSADDAQVIKATVAAIAIGAVAAIAVVVASSITTTLPLPLTCVSLGCLIVWWYQAVVTRRGPCQKESQVAGSETRNLPLVETQAVSTPR
jgi:MFS superfamily sulfate permease-like transporter